MTRFLTLLIFALVAGTAGAQTVAATSEVPEEDLEAYRDAYARFQERIDEIHGDIKRIVIQRYDEELQRIRGSYDTQSREMEAEERRQRLEAIAQHEEFVAKYPNNPYTAHRIFRLANLYLEETDSEFADDWQAYGDLEDEFDRKLAAGEPVDALPEPPGKDYTRAIQLLHSLIERFEQYEYLDAAYYLLGYCYWDELSEQQDDMLAMQTYQDLVRRLPGSQYAANGHFMLGEIYFDELEFEGAIHHYSRVLDYGESPQYDRALYKLAWAFYRQDDLQGAIPRFVQLIDYSDQREAETGKASDMRPESLRYLAISLVDQADDAERLPIDRVEEYFAEAGDKDYNRDVLILVDEVLSQQGRYDEELATLVRFQQLYPFAPENPEFQRKIMALHVNKDNPDVDASVAARIELVERFKEGSPWWEANKNNPDALRSATRYIEESLGDVARVYHANAQALFSEPGMEPARSEYLKAAEAYQDYLNRFPFTSDAYETQYMIAECYFWAADYERALQEYGNLGRYPDRTYEAIAEAYASLHARWWDDKLIHEERHAKSPGGPHCIAAVPSTDEIVSMGSGVPAGIDV